MRKFNFDIDVVGACNLRCPCCPQGNIKDYRLPTGFIEPDRLNRILQKAKSECQVARVSLFSWGEPLLHPRLPELIRIVHQAGAACYLSSNLNILPHVDAIMAENPSNFRISLSGFSQEVYGYTHRGGDIERVKRHMIELAEAQQRNNATTHIYVYYHRYRHNLKEEPLMRQFAAELGFDFQPVWALFFPVEKILAHVGGEDHGFAVTAEDRDLMGHLAVPLEEALAAAKSCRGQPCPLRDESLSLDCQGNVQLCCGIFDPRQFTLGKYLEMPIEDIQRAKDNHPMCVQCMAHGIHRYLIYGVDGFAELALAHIPEDDAKLIDLQKEISQMRTRRLLARTYDKFFARFFSAHQKALLAEHFSRWEQRLTKRRK
jgi:MoaA/NifB/PqqE/SkfB family radical SAM enzyme